MSLVSVSAVVLWNHVGETLLVLKRGTHTWMHPGGKPEAGETPVDAAVREIQEELGLDLDPNRLRHLGDFTVQAANEPESQIEAFTFEYLDPVPSDVAPQAEIEAVRWLAPSEIAGTPNLAPLLTGPVRKVLSL